MKHSDIESFVVRVQDRTRLAREVDAAQENAIASSARKAC